MDQREVLFWVFTCFFVVIGAASISVLLGFRKQQVGRDFRKWAVTGFVGTVTTAVVGLFGHIFISENAKIWVTLVYPKNILDPSPLVKGTYEYDEDDSNGKVMTRLGEVVPTLMEGSWQVRLPGKVADKPVRLMFPDQDGRVWKVHPFYANHTSQALNASATVQGSDLGRSQVPRGVALLLVADMGREPAAQQQASLKFNNHARPIGSRFGQSYYEWRVFVDESSAMLDTIKQVDYVLHPTFPEPFQSTVDRGKNFELNGSGWGSFAILITVHYTNGMEAKATYTLDLHKSWPAVPTLTEQSFELRLDKIIVNEGGSPGGTGWVFDILVDGKTLLSLPKKNYEDDKKNKKNEYPAVGDRWAVRSKGISGQPIRVEVNGKRTFVLVSKKDEAATGVGSIAIGQPLALVVKNADNEKNGSFIFQFSAAALP